LHPRAPGVLQLAHIIFAGPRERQLNEPEHHTCRHESHAIPASVMKGISAPRLVTAIFHLCSIPATFVLIIALPTHLLIYRRLESTALPLENTLFLKRVVQFFLPNTCSFTRTILREL
jgi:hypothetical protein